MKDRFFAFLRWTERYTKTDMVYLFESSFWLQTASFSASIGSFLLYVAFGYALPKDVYGTYQYLLSVGTVVTAFTLTGMNSAVIRAVARGFEGTYREAISVQLRWGLVPLAGSWALGAYYLLHGNPTLGIGLFLIGVFVPLNTTFNTYGVYLTAKRDFKRSFLYGLFSNVPYYLAMVLVAFSLPLALALLAANLISQGLGYYVAHRRVLAFYKPNAERDPEAMRYGAHLSLMRFLTTAITKLDDILVFHFLGAAPLALYSFATAVPDRLNVFTPIGRAAFPKYAEKSRTDIVSSLGKKMVIGIAGALVLALIYGLIAYPFFWIFFPKYLAAVPYSQVYAFMIAVSFGSLFVTALTALGRVKSLYVYNIAAPLMLIACEVVGILGWGLWGLVLGKIAGTLLGSLVGLTLLLL